MRKIMTVLLILTLLVPQGLCSVVLAEDYGGSAASQKNVLIWDKAGEDLEVQNNDVVTIKKTAKGTLYVPDNATVTIVGSVKSGAKGVGFYIGSGAKVKWGAEYCGAATLIGAYGSGTLEIIKGALIENTNRGVYDTISSGSDELRIIVSGGTVRTKGKGSSVFTAYSDVTVNGGTIENSGDNGSTIVCRDIIINGGKVVAFNDTYQAIMAQGLKDNGKNDPNHGNVTVLGGVISSEKHSAIDASGTAFIKGGRVSSTGEEATILGGYNDDGGIKVSGGVVTSTSSDCLLSNHISVSGGVIYSSKAHALSAAGAGASAFSNRIKQAASSTKGKAKVSGGLILARGKTLSDVVDTKSIKVSTSKSKGVICTWNKKGKTKYTRGTKTNLKVHTAKASVRWGKDGKLNGVRYKKGSDKGFFRVKGVTVVNPKAKKTQFSYSLKSKKYDGKRKNISVTPKKGVGKVTAIYYQGADGTKYKKSKVAPKKAGTYKVTINVAKSKKYKAVKGLYLGKFKIKKSS